jgi:uncharacterized protein YcbX
MSLAALVAGDRCWHSSRVPSPARIAWIHRAPIKALALQALEATELTAAGVPGDRAFHLVDARGRMVNGKRCGPLVRAHADWNPETGRLALTLPGGEEVADTIALGEPIESRFSGGSRAGRLVEGPWSAALSELAGITLRLVRSEGDGTGVDRPGDGAVTVLSAKSLETLGAAAGAGTLDARRFRMTLGVEGAEAHVEDGWLDREVRVGDAVIRPSGQTGRCLVTSQDPDTGVADVDTLDALRRTRPFGTEPLPFGVQATVVVPGRVRVGDPVTPAR